VAVTRDAAGVDAIEREAPSSTARLEHRLAATQHIVTTGLRILEMIAAGVELEQVLTALVLVVEEQAPPALGSVLLLDAEGTRLKHSAAPSLPSGYVHAIDGCMIGPRAGSCGAAAYLGRQVIVTDIASDPLWQDYRELALAHGLRACWSTPIMSSHDQVLGTFALYYEQPRGPTPRELEVIDRATSLAGIAIIRQQNDDQLRALSAHIEAAREDERTRVAREIHDELGQALTALKMDASRIEHCLRAASAPAPPEVFERLEGIRQLTHTMIDSVRRIATALRPGVLDDLGLVAALEWQARDFETRTGTLCTVQSSVARTHFEPQISTAVFRIFQEALTNVARHARAHAVSACLTEREGRLRFELQDDGRGFDDDLALRSSSLGLVGMRERARSLGGTFIVSGGLGRGTRIVVELPLAAEVAAGP
jgi:signal transduction histidine kinase